MLTVILLSVQEWLDRDSAGHRADTEGDTSAVRSRVWSPATLQLPPRPPPAFTGGCSEVPHSLVWPESQFTFFFFDT